MWIIVKSIEIVCLISANSTNTHIILGNARIWLIIEFNISTPIITYSIHHQWPSEFQLLNKDEPISWIEHRIFSYNFLVAGSLSLSFENKAKIMW